MKGKSTPYVLEYKLLKLCKQAKYLDATPVWQDSPSGASYLHCSANFLDSRKMTIPGIELRVVCSKRESLDVDIYFYTLLMKIDERKKIRALSVEVYPDFMRSHKNRDGSQIFGSHIHYADTLPFEKVKKIIKQRSLNDGRYYERFVRHIHMIIQAGPTSPALETPWPDDLFSEVLP